MLFLNVRASFVDVPCSIQGREDLLLMVFGVLDNEATADGAGGSVVTEQES